MAAESFHPSTCDRRIGLFLTPGSVAPRVLDALRALGYSLDTSPESRMGEADARADLLDHPPPSSALGVDVPGNRRVWLVDADRLEAFPSPAMAPDCQLLLIAPASARPTADPRIFAQTIRPGGLGAVYEMIQRVLEETPRRSPRVATQLSARCIRIDRRSIGAVRSLSEGGCLLRTRDELRQGAEVDLQIALPHYGLISTRAECRYSTRGDAGLAFTDPDADVRQTISNYVTLQLAAGEAPPATGSSGQPLAR